MSVLHAADASRPTGRVGLAKASAARGIMEFMTASQTWFDAGMQASDQTLPGVLPADCYLCPLCLSPHHRDAIASGDLTREHAPPQSVGGRRVALTCQLCNQGAGVKLDKHLRESEDDLDARAEGRERVRWTVGSVTTVADFHIADDGTMVLASVPHRNQEGQMEALAREIEADVNDGEFKITGIVEHRSVDVAWLKSAYVAAFALFGYAYALHGKLNAVRRQIEHPYERVLEHFHLIQADQPKDRLWVRLAREPRDAASVQVAMGRHLVFLPSIWSDTDIYGQIEAHIAAGIALPGPREGVEYRWPVRPMHLWDKGHITYPGAVGERDTRPGLWASE